MNIFSTEGDQKINVVKQVFHISKILFTPVAIAFLLFMAWQNWNVVVHVFSQAQIEYLLVAIVGWATLYFFYPVFLISLSQSWGGTLRFWKVCFIHVNRLPARYLPGGVWHTVARYVDFQKNGLDKRQLAALLLLENILSLALALLLGGIVLMFSQVNTIWLVPVICSVLLGASLLIISLYMINRFVLQKTCSIRIATYINAGMILAVYWLLAACVFILYVYALFGQSEITESIRIGGVYLFSWGVGYLAFFAPQGVGVFEFVAGNLIHSELDLVSVAIIIAGFRVVILSADILAWGTLKIFMLLKPNR